MDTTKNPLDRAGFELRKWLEDDANDGKVFAWTPEDVARLIRERDEAVQIAREQIMHTLERLADEDQRRADAYYKEHGIPGYMSTHRTAALRDAIATLKKEAVS